MPRLTVSISVAFLILTFSSLPGYGCNGFPVRSYQGSDGTEFALCLPEEKVARTPRWSPKDGNPPLGITRLWQIAEDWAKKEYARYDRVTVNSVTLQSTYSWSIGEKRWFYVVEFTPYIDGKPLFGIANAAAVLMDGTVIAPKKTEPRSKRNMPFPHSRLPKL